MEVLIVLWLVLVAVFVIMIGVLCAILYPLAKEAIEEARRENENQKFKQSNGRTRIKYLLNHKKDNVVGVIQERKEDDKGLWYKVKAGTHTKGKDYYKMRSRMYDNNL